MILYNEKHDLGNNRFVIPFICTDAKDIRTELSPRDRSESENRLLGIIHDRITLALLNKGFDIERISFYNMAITVRRIK